MRYLKIECPFPIPDSSWSSSSLHHSLPTCITSPFSVRRHCFIFSAKLSWLFDDIRQATDRRLMILMQMANYCPQHSGARPILRDCR